MLLELSHKLEAIHQLTFSLPPLLTQKEELFITLAGLRGALFPFLDGVCSSSSITLVDLERLGEQFGRLHGLPPDAGIRLAAEDFGIEEGARFDRAIEKILTRRTSATNSAAGAAKVREQLKIVKEASRELTRLRENALLSQQYFVITHGDAHPANMLREGSGNIRLIDWDLAIRAPAERDLFMFRGRDTLRFEAFYKGYKRLRPAFEISPGLLSFFALVRTVSDIADWAEQLASPHQAEDEAVHSLDGLDEELERLNIILGALT